MNINKFILPVEKSLWVLQFLQQCLSVVRVWYILCKWKVQPLHNKFAVQLAAFIFNVFVLGLVVSKPCKLLWWYSDHATRLWQQAYSWIQGWQFTDWTSFTACAIFYFSISCSATLQADGACNFNMCTSLFCMCFDSVYVRVVSKLFQLDT